MKILIRNSSRLLLSLILLLLLNTKVVAQQVGIVINMGFLEGVTVSPDNIFNYQIMNNEGAARKVIVKGTLVYKQHQQRLSYSYNTTLQPGINYISQDNVMNPQWEFSTEALKELFTYYKTLPQGTYEYCVEVTIDSRNTEKQFLDPVDACVYNTIDDIFLINLISPEDDAKLYEYNPMLAWVVNYPFASELTYKIRVAELNQGQNKEAAISRNNPVYSDANVLTTGMIYPITAKPLVKDQPYVWTVDAYYKGILLGGAEVWQFTIIEDSILKSISHNVSYIDVRREQGNVPIYAVGELKLKYVLDDLRKDALTFILIKEGDKTIKLKDPVWQVKYGDNRIELNFKQDYNLKHMKQYVLQVKASNGSIYKIPFYYINPDFLPANTTEQK